jgi:hypothetical protein
VSYYAADKVVKIYKCKNLEEAINKAYELDDGVEFGIKIIKGKR